jgi:hypothetical protein
MEQYTYSKNELLKNLIIKNNGPYPINVKLINNIVKIWLAIDSPTGITLYAFYKDDNENRVGIARCAFYVLLNFLLENNQITREHICSVSSPTSVDEARLIKIYEQIGFILGDPEPGNPINLKAPIHLLMSTLEKQCLITAI